MQTQALEMPLPAPIGDQPVVAVVPRINIHAFCDSQQTAETLQVAAADRRMSKAHVTIQLGGIAAAIQIYQAAATPNLLIVESRSPRDLMMAELMQLAQVCQPNTKVVVIGHLNDVILYRELIRQGVSEYIVAPVSQLQLIETIATLYHDPKSAPVGRVIAFVGAKGGVGSSTIAHNFGWTASRTFGVETVITDLDLAFGTAGLNFNQEAAQGIFDALGQPDRVDNTLIDRLLTKCSEKLSLLATPGIVDRDVPLEAQSIDTILNVVRNSVPVVVVDVPNMWAPWIKYTLIQSDEVIITATPDLASLRNTKNLIDLLKAARPNDRPPRLILNQVGVPKRPEIPAGEFAKAVGVEPSVIIPYDPQAFGTAASNGQMIGEVAAKSKAVDALNQLADLIMGPAKPPQAGKRGLSIFDKLPKLRKK